MPSSSIDMDVATAKLVVGFRGHLVLDNYSLLTYRVALKLLLAMLLGWTSKTYHEWYEEGKIDDSFDIEIEIQDDFQFILISLDTTEPIAMSNHIRRCLTDIRQLQELTDKHLTLLKQEMYGDFIQSIDSIDHLTSQFNLYLSDKETYFDLPRIIETISLKDILVIGKAFLKEQMFPILLSFQNNSKSAIMELL